MREGRRLAAVSGSLLTALLCFGRLATAQPATTEWKPDIPKTWDLEALRSLEVPLADARFSPSYVSPEYYYSIPEMTIYKSYPVYAPDREPPGYFERLQGLEPEIVFDASTLASKGDWIRAGELVFDAPIVFGVISSVEEVRDPGWYRETGALLAKDGTLPSVRYVIREKGKVELGDLACAHCHSRVMPDGSVLKGAQGNSPFEQAWAYSVRSNRVSLFFARFIERSLIDAPWTRAEAEPPWNTMSADEIAARHAVIPPGVLARQGTRVDYPSRIPDLIGVEKRRYLDATGLQLHRSIGDLMRYAALNQGMDLLSSYGGFVPGGENFKELPDAATQTRYSDEQLYALALYIYSLEPPPNPNPFDDLARQGKLVFEREGCGACHRPPSYTNNRLTPVDGFEVPDAHRTRFDVMPLSVGTDPNLALTTRRGTGYYKVPSLRGLWYRNLLEHNGSVGSLEEWFDKSRLRDDFVSTGFKGSGVEKRAVKGHEVGLDLSVEDRKALIAFLRTL